MLAVLSLAALLSSCATNVAPSTMAAIVSVESAGDPYAIGDNTSGQSYRAGSRESAERLATMLLGEGHSLDLGLAQINDANLAPLGLSVASIFDPCTNLRAGATILGGDYRRAAGVFGAGQTALRHALRAYNTGSLYTGASYEARVVAASYRLGPSAGAERTFDGLAEQRDLKALDATVASLRARAQARPAPRAPENAISPYASPIMVQAAWSRS